MQRRDFVRAMMVAGLAPRFLMAQQATNPAPPPPAPTPWTLGLNPKTPVPHTAAEDAFAEGDLTFFSPEQMATLTRLSDLLVPAVGTEPGALQAETPVFLDFLIGSSPATRQKLYTGGLDWLETQSQSKFGVAFSQTQPAQADALVKPWLRTWMNDHPPTEPHADFLNIAHADIRTATMNSEAWSEAAPKSHEDAQALGLYWSPIDPDIYAENFNGVHVRPSPVVDAPRSSHTTPSYPQ
ncbi:MAG: gluconate 2-dehydrogenase subunit 3 family protein [Janthinobacterium lividum]